MVAQQDHLIALPLVDQINITVLSKGRMVAQQGIEAADLSHLIDLGAPIQRSRIVDIDFVGRKPLHSVGKVRIRA